MPRSRVLSFMSQWGGAPRSPTPDAGFSEKPTSSPSADEGRRGAPAQIDTITPQAVAQMLDASAPNSPSSPGTASRARGDSKPKRLSVMQAYNPPQVEVANDTPPELQPIFTYLNSHSNKLYQEGYFLKLHDLDSRGRPSQDRVWTECFAQLIGTVLSLWDAAALDVAGEDAEVVPTFVNLSDASIKMIESLPMNGAQGGSLQNVLSISTAANNRYLLHFNTLSSLTQWTAGIRLAMFEHATLQEAYTGSLIAGKGRYLNNIKQIMFRSKYAHEDWARVRFGAGTPWQRCWCVISPPDEKDYEKALKAQKKASPYDRIKFPKGEIKFFDTRKVTKKTRPIATISDAYAAYAIYPQSKPLIEQSTLLKLEGMVSIYGGKESTTEGFVFVMPEAHQAVTGFEIMLRWLFPAFDTFGLYGRPNKLIADTLDQRGLMFAMPTTRRYGYLDILDVSGLIHTKGSQAWSERQWRRELKKLTAERMMASIEGTPRTSRQDSRRRNTENTRPGVRFGNGEVTHSTPGSRSASPSQLPGGDARVPSRQDSAPPTSTSSPYSPHKRSASEAIGYRKYISETPSRLSHEASRPDTADGPFAPPPFPPPPPQHGGAPVEAGIGRSFGPSSLERIQSGVEVPTQASFIEPYELPTADPHLSPPAPVGPPPAFMHSPNSRPANEPHAPPELVRANSNVDAATLQEMRDAMRRQPSENSESEMWNGELQQRQQNTVASHILANRSLGVPADRSQGALNRSPRDPRQRLSTIPGSPFVGSDAEYSQSPQETTLPQMGRMLPPPPPPPPNEEMAPPVQRPGMPSPVHSSHSIARKPVPRALPQPPHQPPQSDGLPPLSRSLTDPTNSPMPEDLEHVIINEALLDGQFNTVEDPFSDVERLSTTRSTRTESTEPDYASTRSSSPKKKQSIEKARTGRLKTVGDPTLVRVNTGSEEGEQQATIQPLASADLPNIDFGRTYAYKPTIGSRPESDATIRPEDMADKRRSRSADRLMTLSREDSSIFRSSANSSPNGSKRFSYVEDDNLRAPSRAMTDYPEERSNVMWQPGDAGLHRSKTSITPEEWVQQKSAMALQPQYAPPPRPLPDRYAQARSQSVQQPQGRRKLTKTPPPFVRNTSGDWTQARQTPSPRPSSRAAGMNLDTAGQSLSATEQMQVSRATGSPLVNLSDNLNKQPVPQAGLIGAVGQREREKAASKEGRNSMLVQQAIERQQQQQRWEAEAQAQQQYEMQMQHQQMQMQQYNQQIYMQNQQYAQSRPGFQQSNSWQYAPEQQGGYGQSSPSQYDVTDGHYAPQGRRQQDQQQQAYGSNYFPQQQQQQYGRR